MLAWLVAILACFMISASLAATTSALGIANSLELKASRAAKLLSTRDLNISAGRLGIWISMVASGALWAGLLSHWLNNTDGSGAWLVAAPLVALLVVLYAIMGYQLPQRFALKNPEGALKLAAPLALPLLAALRPVAKAAEWVLNKIMPLPKRSDFTPYQQLSRLMSRSSLDVGLEETSMLVGVLELSTKQVKQVMTPGPAVAAIDEKASVKQASEKCLESRHTRLVVTRRSEKGNIVGVLHAATLLENLLLGNHEISVGELASPALLVPPSKPLDQLLLYLQHRQHYLAVVVDEYGRMGGIVSIEDIIEEIVGEIEDETDIEQGDLRRLANGDIIAEGYMHINELRQQGVELPSMNGVKSVGGYVFSSLGRLPKPGDQIRVDGYELIVEAMDDTRVAEVRITSAGNQSDSAGPHPEGR